MEELHTSHEGCIAVTEEYNQLGSSASSTMVYSNPLVFKCLSFSSILLCFCGCLNFLVPLYLLGTRGQRREMWVVSVSCKFPLPWHLIHLYLIRECLQLRILCYHQCISNIHYGSLYQSADNHCCLDSLLITPFLFRYYSYLPFWWALLQCCHHCQARMDYCCRLEFTLCVALILMNMLFFWSLVKQITVLFMAVVWDRKTCGWAASASHLDNTNSLLMIVV